MGIMEALKSAFSPKKPMMGEEQEASNDGQLFNAAFKSKEAAIDFVKKEFERRQKERRPIELQWSLNMNMLMGNQYCDISLLKNQVVQIDKLYNWENRDVYNQIAPIYETRLSKLCKIKPEPLARPASGETSDIAAAEISTRVAKAADIKEKMNDKRTEIIGWMELTGACFVKHIWDTTDGEEIGQDETGMPVFEGDERKVVVNPFEVFPDSNFSNGVEGCKSIIHAKAYHKNDVEEKWGKQLKGEKVDVFTLNQSNIGTGGLGLNTTVYTYVQTQVEDHIVVMEYTSLPCKMFPKGIVMIVGGNELLEYREMTFNIEDKGKPGLPYEMYSCVKCPGHFWPTSIIERLIPIQRSYNAVKNRKHEALNRKSIGVLDVEDDGNLDVEDLENEGIYPGKILVHPRGGQAARFLQDNISTTDYDNEEQRLERLFERISGVSAFSSFSSPPSGVESGRGLEQLRDMDDSRIGLTADNINNAAIRSAKITLRMYKQFSVGPRLLRLVGENNDVLLGYWQASDLTADDIIVEKEDALAQTVAQRRQMVVELLQYGLFKEGVDTKMRSNVLKSLEFGDWENLDSMEDLHKNKSLRENQKVLQAMVSMPDDFDDHNIHITEHNRFRLSVEYEQIRQQNPELAEAFNQHILIHEQFLMQKIQQQMMMQMAVQEQAKPQQKPQPKKEESKAAG